MKWFNHIVLQLEDPNDKVVVMAMIERLQSKADKYIAAEELAEAKRRRRGRDDKRKETNTR